MWVNALMNGLISMLVQFVARHIIQIFFEVYRNLVDFKLSTLMQRQICNHILYINSLSACVCLSDATVLRFNCPGPALIGGRNFLFLVYGQSLGQDILTRNGVTDRVRSGLSVTELGNFCSREHPLREVISSHFSKSFSSSTMSV